LKRVIDVEQVFEDNKKELEASQKVKEEFKELDKIP